MDPNEALKNAREAAASLRTSSELDIEEQDIEEQVAATERLLESFEALDSWLSRDGFLPADWQSDDEKAARRG